MIPTVSKSDSSDEYITLDRGLIVRAPIIKDIHHGQTLNNLEETRFAWTDEFKAANPILWEQLFQMLGKTTVWEHTKNTQRIKNEYKAYRAISLALFGDTVVFFRSKRHKKEITAMTYKGESCYLSWADYVNRHLTLHNQRDFLEIRAENLGHNVSPLSEYKEVGHLLNGIADGILYASKNDIICDHNGLRLNFAKYSRHISDFLESTAASSSGKNRNISEVSGDRNSCNRNGQVWGNGSPHGTHGGGGKRQRSNRDPWTQARVDTCAHITEKRYSDVPYRTFNGNERHIVWQKSKGLPKYSDATPSNQIIVSQVTLSKL